MNDARQKPNRRFFLGTSFGAVAGATVVTGSPVADASVSCDRFREFTRLELPLTGLRRVAVDRDGHLLVAAGNSLHRIDRDGESLCEIQLDRPVRCVAIDGDQIFVGIRDHVRMLNYDGRLQHRLPSIGRGHLVNDVICADGSIFVADITSRTLKRLTENGNWMTFASGKTGFDMAVEGRIFRLASGRLSMTNPKRHRVEALSTSGNVERTWGRRARDQSGFQGCCNPLAAVPLHDGSIVTAEAGQVRLKRFGDDGSFIQQIAGPDVIATPAVTATEAERLGCRLGGIDLAVSSDELWMLHASAKQLIGWRQESIA